MKFLVMTLVSMMLAAPALACVAFSGTWQCDYNQKVVLSVDLTPEGFVLKNGTTSFLLNGVSQHVSSPLPYDYVGTCSADTLQLAITVFEKQIVQTSTLTSLNDLTTTLDVDGKTATVKCTR